MTADGAQRYGVVISADGSMDTVGTKKLRAKLVKERGDDIPLFNFGGTIEEIKARSLEETHLEPPITPTFKTVKS